MPSFDSDGVEIAYMDEGEGAPILLVHGFASNVVTNWVDPGWVRMLAQSGRRVIAYDNRGHGRSEKLYDPEVYGAASMAEDARRLLDHLAIAQVDVMGYSMGARIAAFLVLAHQGRVRSAVLGGLGINMVKGTVGSGPIAKALEAPRIEDVVNETARSFRAFAEQTRSDLKALAACIRGPRERITPEQLATIAVPTLVAVGSNDVIDHMRAVGDAAFRQGVLDFLTQRP
jgi:pimeloyl-ACP methyl ester carboxylesterase